MTIINEIDENVFPLLSSNNNVDIIGQFYNEFLRYAGGDQQTMGIVLTPSHITELFTDLVPLSSSSIIYDPCSGTGGFLISGMKKLFTLLMEIKIKF